MDTCSGGRVREDGVQMGHGGVAVLTVGAADRRRRPADGRGLLLRLGPRLRQGLRRSVAQTSKVHAEGLGKGSEGPRGPRDRHRTT